MCHGHVAPCIWSRLWTDGGVGPRSAATGVDMQLGRSTSGCNSSVLRQTGSQDGQEEDGILMRLPLPGFPHL